MKNRLFTVKKDTQQIYTFQVNGGCYVTLHIHTSYREVLLYVKLGIKPERIEAR